MCVCVCVVNGLAKQPRLGAVKEEGVADGPLAVLPAGCKG